jgi:hypothetical protein
MLNDTWIYQLSSNTWLQVPASSGGPPAINLHTATAYKDRVIVLGGHCIETQYSQQVFEFNVTSRSWRSTWTLGGYVQVSDAISSMVVYYSFCLVG